MRRNCICRCGTQLRAPNRSFKLGIDCPNCGNRVTFEEQYESSETDPQITALVDYADRPGPGMKTNFGGVNRRFSPVNSLFLVAFILGGFALGAAIWIVAASIDPFRQPFAQPKDYRLEKTRSTAFDWSKETRWDTHIDPLEGVFSGSQTARGFTSEASANRYNSIERLFDYGPMIEKIVQGRKELKSFRSGSPESIAQQLRSLVLGFLDDSKWITSGYHHWRTIGVVTQNDRTAVLIRYYRESTTPIELLDSEEILLPLTKMVSFNNVKLHCSNLFKTKLPERRTDPKLQGYNHSQFYADKTFGYMVLMLSGTGPNDEIEDVFDFQTQRPLSHLCSVWTGASSAAIDQLITDKIALPGPSDQDLQTIQGWLNFRTNKLRGYEPAIIRKSLENVYAQTNDPLMLDLLGRLESDQGNKDLALEEFRKAEQGRFQSLESYRATILNAVESNDQELLIERLSDLTNYWEVKLTGLDAEEDRKRYYKFQDYWRRNQELRGESSVGAL